MRKALVTIGGILVAMLGALFIVPAFIDWNSYRGALEEEVSRVVGRDVRVGGAVSLRLLPFPYVSFEKVRITDNAGVLGEPFFRAEVFTMWLSVAPLLRGAVEASEVELRRPVVTLAIDAAGAGNWADFKVSQGSLPFVPADIALQSVNIVDGTVQVQGPGQAEIIRIESIFGDLSSEAIDGPYKFRGTARWRGLPREIRVATAKLDADGSLRFKSSVRATDSGSSYVMDARVVDLKSRPRVDGELTATLAGPGSVSAEASAKAKRAGEPTGNLDFKTVIAADSRRASLSEIVISFDHGGQPQLVTGSADVAWLGGLRMAVKLGSPWLDLDKLAAAGAGDQPFDTVRTLVGALQSLLPEAGDVESSFNVEQVSLGGEAVSGLRLAIARSGGPLQVNDLRASLPGGTRLELNGTIATGPKGTSFLGDIGVRGASYARFMGWGAKGLVPSDTRSDGPFSLQGRLSLAEGGIELAEATAELIGTPLTGQLSYRWDGRRRVDVALTGQQVDVAALLPGGIDLDAIRQMLWPGTAVGQPAVAPASAGPPPATRGLDTRSLDLKLKLRIAELVVGDRTLLDVDADAALTAGKLSLPSLRLKTPEGLALDLEGDVAEIASQTPSGTLRWVVDAADQAAVDSLANLLGPASSILPGAETLEGLLPIRMAGSMRLGGRTTAARDITFDGLVSRARVVGAAKLDAGLQDWRKGPVDLTLSGDTGNAARLVSLLWPGSKPTTPGDKSGVAGRFAVRAAGTPAAGMMSLAAVETAEASITFDGRAWTPREGGRDLDGVVRIAARDAGRVLELLGRDMRGATLGAPVQGQLAVVAKDGAFRISPSQLRLGETEVAGLVSITPGKGQASVDASLSFNSATIPGMLAVLSDPRSAGGGPPRPGAAFAWPEAAFDLSVLEAIAGKARLRFGLLGLAPGVELSDVTLDAKVEEGRLAITKLDGRALGGSFSARANLERATVGAVLSGALRLDGGNLSALGAPGVASGPLSFSLQFDGRAISPQAMIGALTGRGEVGLGNSRVGRLGPVAVQTVANQLIESRGEITGEPLKTALRDALASTQLPIAARKIELQIAEGVVKAQPTSIETPEGRAVVETVIDLASLKVDSEWRLEPAPSKQQGAQGGQGAAAKPLPPVSIVFVGALGRLAAIEPRLNAEGLERELAVRRMERDVEELEKIRKFDEERARQEMERLKALEAERATSAAVEPAPGPGGPSAAPSQPVTQPGPPPGPTAQPSADVQPSPSRPPATAQPARGNSASPQPPRPKQAPFRPFGEPGQTQ